MLVSPLAQEVSLHGLASEALVLLSTLELDAVDGDFASDVGLGVSMDSSGASVSCTSLVPLP